MAYNENLQNMIIEVRNNAQRLFLEMPDRKVERIKALRALYGFDLKHAKTLDDKVQFGEVISDYDVVETLETSARNMAMASDKRHYLNNYSLDYSTPVPPADLNNYHVFFNHNGVVSFSKPTSLEEAKRRKEFLIEMDFHPDDILILKNVE